MQKLLQLSSFDQLIEEELQSLVILCSMTSVLMIMIVKILISLNGVSSHSIGPFKVGLILNLSLNTEFTIWVQRGCRVPS